MQNVDQGEDDLPEQILGSVKWHNGAMDDYEPKAILVNYNETEDKQDVLIVIFDKIYKKNYGSNEMTELKTGLTPDSIRFSINLRDKSYLASKTDGLLEFDGIGVITQVNTINLKDIIIAKETNRCFGINTDNQIVWTDDLASIGGVPLTWNALNVDTIPPTEGDVPEKLFILNGRLVVLMTHSIWIYYINGSPANWRPEHFPTSVGCVAPKTARIVGTEIWFLGFSPQTGRNIYGVNSSGQARRLAYDFQPFFGTINETFISEACAEYVDNLYKVSVPVGQSQVNNFTVHLDVISTNPDTGAPNIYGPHTYGFNCSSVLNTRKFKGEHLFGRKASDGGRIYKVADYQTQYSNELTDDGELIQTVLFSKIFDTEEVRGVAYGPDWEKRYSNLFLEYPPRGSHSANVEILKGYENETYESFDQYWESNNFPLESVIADEDALDFAELGIDQHIFDFVADAFQVRITNSSPRSKFSFRAFNYDARPHRRKKHVQKICV